MKGEKGFVLGLLVFFFSFAHQLPTLSTQRSPRVPFQSNPRNVDEAVRFSLHEMTSQDRWSDKVRRHLDARLPLTSASCCTAPCTAPCTARLRAAEASLHEWYSAAWRWSEEKTRHGSARTGFSSAVVERVSGRCSSLARLSFFIYTYEEQPSGTFG